MNTMKRDDMIKEKEELETTILHQVLRTMLPISSMLSAMQRLMYLCNELDKSRPKPASLVKDEPPVKVDLSGEGEPSV